MSVDYREKYKFLKRKLKILVYEHEALNQELEKSQRKLLKVARDKSFLMDRLLHYEQVVVDSPADSDVTLSSDSESGEPAATKRKVDPTKTTKSEPLRNDAALPTTEPEDDKELKDEVDVKEEFDSRTDQSALSMQGDTLDPEIASATDVA